MLLKLVINELFLYVCLISAILPREILEMTSKFMIDPKKILVKILVKRGELTQEVTKCYYANEISTTSNLGFDANFCSVFHDYRELSSLSLQLKERSGS